MSSFWRIALGALLLAGCSSSGKTTGAAGTPAPNVSTPADAGNTPPVDSGVTGATNGGYPDLPIDAPDVSIDGRGTVTITDEDASAVIRYTVDGSTPTATSDVYGVPFLAACLNGFAGVVKAKAFDANWGESGVATATFVPHSFVDAVRFSPAAGTFDAPVAVTLTCDNGTIHFTTDGTPPTKTSPSYTVPITVDHTLTIQAMAIRTTDECGNPANEMSVITSNPYTVSP